MFVASIDPFAIRQTEPAPANALAMPITRSSDRNRENDELIGCICPCGEGDIGLHL